MVRWSLVIAGFCSFAWAGIADATEYTLKATGTVTDGRLHDYTANTDSALPSGLIKVGDSFSFSATFDTAAATLTSLYDADPTVNIYYLNGSRVTLAAGSYLSTFTPKFDISASAQLWNDRAVTPTLLVDSQSFEFSNYNYSGPYPFNLTSAPIRSELISLQSYDFSHTVRNSDLISELVSSSTPFGSNSLSYSYSTSDSSGKSYEAAFLTIGSLSYTLTSAVPEPGTWAMMIVGFGLAGTALRRRRSVTARAAFA